MSLIYQSILISILTIISFSACQPTAEGESDSPIAIGAEVQNTDTAEEQATPDETADETNFTFSFTSGINGLDPTNIEASLVALYGRDQVMADTIYLPDGIATPGYRVFAGTPNELEVLEPESSTGYEEVLSCIRSAGEWASEEGIYVGMPLEELVELNGAPLNFSGFAWDYGGFVSNFNGGELLSPGIRLDVVYDEEEPLDIPMEIMGEVQLRSDDPILEGIEIVVSEMSVTNTTDPVKIGTFLVGHHFDQIRSGDEPEDLRRYYGDRVTEVQISLGEGEFASGYEVDLGEGNQFKISLNSDSSVEAVTFTSEETTFYEPNVYQLLPGLDLAGLQAINGAPIEFLGFGWDYEGTVTDFNGGELEGYEIKLAPIEADNSDLLGDGAFRSDEIDQILLLNFKVVEVGVPL